MTDLREYLKERIRQCEARVIPIENYLKNPLPTLHKKEYGQPDIDKLRAEAKEASVALDAVNQYRRKYAADEKEKQRTKKRFDYYNNGGDNGPTGHGPDDCFSDADCGL